MKKLNLILSLFIGSALFMGGCDFVNEEINIDPNRPTDVSMALLLPPTQTSYAFVAGGDFGRFATIWTQQHSGVERQHAGYEVYQLKEGDVNNGWTTMYADVLNELLTQWRRLWHRVKHNMTRSLKMRMVLAAKAWMHS